MKQHWKNLIIESEHNIIGRGYTVVINYIRNNISDSDLPKAGDYITYNNKMYEIRSVETLNYMLTGKPKPNIGLVLRDVENR